MADEQRNRLLDFIQQNHGAPLHMRNALSRQPEWTPYEYMGTTDPLAASRMGMDVMRGLGLGNPAGAIPGAMGVGSDIYGAMDPEYQARMTERARLWLQQNQMRDNAGDAQNQPGGFYGNRR